MKRSLVLMALCSSVALAEPAASPLDLASAPSAPFNQERFQLGYDVYLANGNLAAAYRVAERGVQERPRDVEWRRRLATVAQWLNKPEVALANWLAIARQTGDAAAWREVGRIAPAVADSEAMLAYWQHELQRQPGNEKALKALLASYEQAGRPDEALLVLKRQPRSRAVLEAEADLAERTGHDEVAVAALMDLNRRFGPDEAWVVRAAGLHLQRGQVAQAEALLASAEPAMPATALQFWQLRADVAELSGDQAAAVRAYGRIEASGKASSDSLTRQADLLQEKDPLAAARLQVLAWQTDHKPEAVESALYHWSRVEAWAPAEAFLATLTADELARLEQHPGFLQQRANLHLARGRGDAAGRDLRAAMALAPRDNYLRQAWMAWLVSQGEPSVLRRMLQEGRSRAARQPDLWPVWAAGWNRLDAPDQARPWLQAHYRLRRDDLSALALADTLRADGREAQALVLENSIWSRRLGAAPRSVDLQREYADALFRLQLARLPVDARRQSLRTLITHEQGKDGRVREYVRDLVLGEAWVGEAIDTEPPRVGRELPSDQPLPLWSQLGTALLMDDTATLETLLETPDRLPANDRTVAAIRLGRTGQASELASDSAETRPFDDVADQYLQERIWRDGDRVDIAIQYEDWDSLYRDILAVDLVHGLTEHLHLHLAHEAARLSSDPQQIRLPEDQQAFSLAGLIWQGERLRMEGALTYLDGIDTEAGLYGDLQWNAYPWLFEARGGLAQPATDTAGLRVGGYKDYLQLGTSWQVTPRNSLQLQLEHALYSAQGDDGELGDADTLTASWRYQLMGDVALITRLVELQSQAESTLPASLLPVLPVGAPANPAFFVPAPYTQAGFGMAFGETAEAGYQRRWRPFGHAGLTYDSVVDLGYEGRIGVLGPVIGRDRLRFYASGSYGAQVNAAPSLTLNLDYLFFY